MQYHDYLQMLSFNEAPIHESGKCRLGSDGDSEPAGFNEAPIHESGKFFSSRTRCPMRSGFNEAPIHESGKSETHGNSTVFTLASMRPRFMNRGSALPWCSPWFRCRASMRPRFMNRGSEGGRERDRRRARASMRPRFMNRGSRPPSARGRRRCWSFNEAPIHESGKWDWSRSFDYADWPLQ